MNNVEFLSRIRLNSNQISEFIVKFNGDIQSVGKELGAVVEVLSNQYAIITLLVSDLPKLYNYRQIEYIELPKKLFTAISNGLNYSCITPVKRPASYELNGKGVITAIIDSGIDYLHPEFVAPDGTSRIAWLWDQTIPSRPPNGFSIGSEYSNSQINEALNSSSPHTIVPSIDNANHGTPVAAIACGNSGVASSSVIIAVKLGFTDTLKHTRTTEIMRAIKYVLDKATEMNMPCSINLSYGSNEGSHSGDTLFETFINDMTSKWKNSIVIASGNEGASGHHYFNTIRTNQINEIFFTIATQSKSMYVSIWKNFADIISFELISPSGKSSGIISATNQIATTIFDGVKVSGVFLSPSHYGISHEVYFYLESLSDSLPTGVITIIARAENVVDGAYNIWLPTDEEVSPDTAFLLPTTDLTMTIPSTASNLISVGGYRASADTISSFSGRGDPMCNSKVKLDIVAPAENILTASTGGGYSLFTGTSMAAPFVAGSAALMMEWGIIRGNDPFLYGQKVKAFLSKNASRGSSLFFPNSIWGYGRLNLCRTISDMQDYAWGGF